MQASIIQGSLHDKPLLLMTEQDNTPLIASSCEAGLVKQLHLVVNQIPFFGGKKYKWFQYYERTVKRNCKLPFLLTYDMLQENDFPRNHRISFQPIEDIYGLCFDPLKQGIPIHDLHEYLQYTITSTIKQ